MAHEPPICRLPRIVRWKPHTNADRGTSYQTRHARSSSRCPFLIMPPPGASCWCLFLDYATPGRQTCAHSWSCHRRVMLLPIYYFLIICHAAHAGLSCLCPFLIVPPPWLSHAANLRVAADHFPLLHLPFGILSLNISALQNSDSLSAFRGLLKTFLYQKSLPPQLSIACTMSPRISTYVLTMDSSLPCISHIAPFRQNNMIAWKGRPRCFHLKTKRALNSLLLLSCWCLFLEHVMPCSSMCSFLIVPSPCHVGAYFLIMSRRAIKPLSISKSSQCSCMQLTPDSY